MSDVCSWPFTTLAAMQRFRRYWGISGLVETAVNRSFMTHSRHAARTDGGYNLLVRTGKL